MGIYQYEDLIKSVLDERECKTKEKGSQIMCLCPFHKDGKEEKRSFGINMETGLFNCFTCSAKGNIVQFISKMKEISIPEALNYLESDGYEIGRNNSDSYYTLSMYANEKHLDKEFLAKTLGLSTSEDGKSVRIPYYDEEDNQFAVRYRNHPNSKTRFYWGENSKANLYGRHLIERFPSDYVILVEGESDAQCAWFNEIYAIGVPGAKNFKKDYAKLFEKFKKIYIHQEPDQGGYEFTKKICQCLPPEKLYTINSYLVDYECKDLADLHVKGLLNKDSLLKTAQPIPQIYLNEINMKSETAEHVILAEKVLEELDIRFYKGDFYVYENGFYKEGLAKIEKVTQGIDKNLKKFSKAEILDYIRIAENIDTLTLDKNLINFKNGIYHIDTDTLQPHSPEIFTLCQINADYLNDDEFQKLQQSETNKYIDKFFADICCGKEDRIDALQEFIGYSMTYDVSLQKCLFLHGTSADNGKSTFNNLFKSLIGEGNYCTVSISEFSERFSGSDILNKLANVVHELESVTLRDVAKFKSAISGDVISVEEKYKRRYSIQPFAHHIFAMNNLPVLKNCSDKGFFRRLHIVPFKAKFTDEEKNEFDFDKLITKDSLNYLANISLRKYFKMRQENRRKFSNVEESNHLIEVYTSKNNSALLFLSDKSNFIHLLNANNRIKQGNLYDAYEDWCYDNDLETFNKKDFKRAVFETGNFRNAPPYNGYDCYEYMNIN